MIPIDNKFDIGEVVYLKTDDEQSKRLVTAIQVDPNGLSYRISMATIETWHYDFEISHSRDFVLRGETNE